MSRDGHRFDSDCLSLKEGGQMANKYVKLPIIKEIEVERYELYEKSWQYKFKKGLNLFIGGNRLGKTTSVYIILFGIVGIPTDKTHFFSSRIRENNCKYDNPIVRLVFKIGSDSVLFQHMWEKSGRI